MPHPTRRRWIKLWTQESLYGSICRELEPGERWAWIGLLLLAGDSVVNGQVCAAPDVPYTDEQIAKILALPLQDWQSAKAKMLEHSKIELNGSGIINIVNWIKYQAFDRTEYQREYMRGVRQRVSLTDVRQSVSLQEEEGRGEEDKDTSYNKDMSSSKRDMSTIKTRVSRKKRANTDIRVKEIMQEVWKHLGYPEKVDRDPIPNPAKEGQFIKKMLGRKFSPQEILALWKEKMSQRGGQFVSMQWVNEDIGKGKAGHPADRVPRRYTRPEELDAADHEL